MQQLKEVIIKQESFSIREIRFKSRNFINLTPAESKELILFVHHKIRSEAAPTDVVIPLIGFFGL